MRLGMNATLAHSSPEEWGNRMRELGCGSVVFPVDYKQEQKVIDSYVKAAKENGLAIAEVGTWCSPVAKNKEARKAALERCIEQLKLADYVGARCCVNVSGAAGEKWDLGYQENFSPAFYDKVVESIRKIIDGAKPKHTFYTMEPMPWMVPTGPGEYEKLIKDVDRRQFGVHMDMANWMCSPKRYFGQEAFMDKVFKKLGSRIRSCHIKDVKLLPDYTFQVREVPCGEGGMNLEYYVKKINEANPGIPVLIEHLHSEREYLMSLEYVQNRMRRAGLA